MTLALPSGMRNEATYAAKAQMRLTLFARSWRPSAIGSVHLNRLHSCLPNCQCGRQQNALPRRWAMQTKRVVIRMRWKPSGKRHWMGTSRSGGGGNCRHQWNPDVRATSGHQSIHCFGALIKSTPWQPTRCRRTASIRAAIRSFTESRTAVGRCVCDHPTLNKFGVTPDGARALQAAIIVGATGFGFGPARKERLA